MTFVIIIIFIKIKITSCLILIFFRVSAVGAPELIGLPAHLLKFIQFRRNQSDVFNINKAHGKIKSYDPSYHRNLGVSTACSFDAYGSVDYQKESTNLLRELQMIQLMQLGQYQSLQ